MYFVYVLQNLETHNHYTGITNNLERRLREHRFSSQLIHVEICSDSIQARKLEKYFKSGYGREIINEIQGVAQVAEWYTR